MLEVGYGVLVVSVVDGGEGVSYGLGMDLMYILVGFVCLDGGCMYYGYGGCLCVEWSGCERLSSAWRYSRGLIVA